MFSFLSRVTKVSLHHTSEYSITKGRRQEREKRNIQMENSNVLLVTTEEIQVRFPVLFYISQNKEDSAGKQGIVSTIVICPSKTALLEARTPPLISKMDEVSKGKKLSYYLNALLQHAFPLVFWSEGWIR